MPNADVRDSAVEHRLDSANTAGALRLNSRGQLPPIMVDVLATLILHGPVRGPDDYERFLELSGLKGAGRDERVARQRLGQLASARLVRRERLGDPVYVEITAKGRQALPEEALARVRRHLLTNLLLSKPSCRMQGPVKSILADLLAELPQAGWTSIQDLYDYLKAAKAAGGWLQVGYPIPRGQQTGDRTQLQVRLLKRLDGSPATPPQAS